MIRWVSLFVVVFQSVSTENAYSAQMNVAICTIYSLFLEYFKVWIKNSGDFSHYHSKITQFDLFLSVLNIAKLARKSWDLLHRSCWVSLEISILRTSPRMEVPLVPSHYCCDAFSFDCVEKRWHFVYVFFLNITFGQWNYEMKLSYGTILIL